MWKRILALLLSLLLVVALFGGCEEKEDTDGSRDRVEDRDDRDDEDEDEDEDKDRDEEENDKDSGEEEQTPSDEESSGDSESSGEESSGDSEPSGEAGGETSVGVIGGADGPTEIFTSMQADEATFQQVLTLTVSEELMNELAMQDSSGTLAAFAQGGDVTASLQTEGSFSVDNQQIGLVMDIGLEAGGMSLILEDIDVLLDGNVAYINMKQLMNAIMPLTGLSDEELDEAAAMIDDMLGDGYVYIDLQEDMDMEGFDLWQLTEMGTDMLDLSSLGDLWARLLPVVGDYLEGEGKLDMSDDSIYLSLDKYDLINVLSIAFEDMMNDPEAYYDLAADFIAANPALFGDVDLGDRDAAIDELAENAANAMDDLAEFEQLPDFQIDLTLQDTGSGLYVEMYVDVSGLASIYLQQEVVAESVSSLDVPRNALSMYEFEELMNS